jgi:hypothetical protein
MAQGGAGITHAEAQDLDAGDQRLVDVDPRRTKTVVRADVGAEVVSHAKRFQSLASSVMSTGVTICVSPVSLSVERNALRV